jgi:methionine-gamma-lyase
MKHNNPVDRLAMAHREFGEHGGVNMSVENSTTYTVMEPDTMPALFEGALTAAQGCYLYGRHFNPTVYHLASQIAAMERSEAAYCTASGMAAVSGALLTLCNSGDHIVSSRAVYGGTWALLNDFLPAKANITTRFVDVTDLRQVESAIRPETRVIYVESVSNPTLRVADLPALAKIARRHGVRLVVDNTFSPMMISPIELGADVVVHSLTKYINGASDVIAGAVCGPTELVAGMMDLTHGPLMLLGPTMDPGVASAIALRIPHLALRMAEHSRRAMCYAERLADRGMDVCYPGLSSHPDHDLMQSLHDPQYGFGGVLTLDVGCRDKANELMSLLQNRHHFGLMAVSLGYFDTLMTCPGSSTSSEMTDESMAEAGIGEGLLRIAVGYTGSVEQRWQQFEGALHDAGLLKPVLRGAA